ncbi:hypothetical protein Q0590_05375 [Rhodocytophaga aerolata]|uniref:DUF4348 domain-containing protein n=1 Tax=Rhodocytophaga aerolata TaxID=455078 RepID=A0ABT8R0Q8_9BACT|nr:hypothetical protein [Rhodocytophaga aerolata]MDO1445668.1 hypothetical protein [Rhodocytophaga aerolata]
MKEKIKLLTLISLSLILGWTFHSVWEHYKYEIFKPRFFDSYDSFDTFYHLFSTDSTYQKEHIGLPLPYKVWIGEHYELVKEETWKEPKHVNVPMDFETILYDNFDGEMTGGKRLLIYNNTFYYFEFQREKETWYLIKVDTFI